MSVRVIGAGFGRTGTTSLEAALEELGFGPCYSMEDSVRSPEHVEAWTAAARGETVDWRSLLEGYRSALDWPAASFYEELAEAYPEARVILTVRDPDRWYESTLNTIYGVPKTPYASPVLSFLRLVAPKTRHATRMTEGVIWDGAFSGRFEDREHAIGVYERHIEEVKERVPAGRLLVYSVKQGWGPLCEFLGVEEPAGRPFPHLNDTKSFLGKVRRRFVLPVAVPVVGLALASLGLLAHRLLR
ncbi:sulfotransferase family protein [Rubrobacter marinus]|uniref:Sulfotransferase family protein n=1 Tax=Rubrobacter marinus TaxID=2653852 RepID=A0A6G8PWK7_9ACTN|nr:sulfotransferase family protein [Rubrobacter marinus]QIN78588.1 sulfotransferase family protein [Rubrobacter marinus]